MTTIAYTRQSRLPLLLLVLLAVVGLLLAATDLAGVHVNNRSHAVARHGFDAIRVRDCLSKDGSIQVWKNPTTNRHARVCMIDMFTFGIQIVNKKGEEITAFIDPSDALRSVEAYLERVGYVLLQ